MFRLELVREGNNWTLYQLFSVYSMAGLKEKEARVVLTEGSKKNVLIL